MANQLDHDALLKLLMTAFFQDFLELFAPDIVHLEHQAQADAHLDRRMFRYFARFYDRFDMPIIPIALCPYTRPRKAARDRHALALVTQSITLPRLKA
jgi:hypothetical protein